MIRSLLTNHIQWLIYMFFNIFDFIEAEWSSTLSRVTIVYWISLQLDILCTSAVKWYYAENNISLFTCHLFSCVSKLMKAKKTFHRVVWTSVFLTSCSEDLCNKICKDKTSETLTVCSAFPYTARSDKPGCNKRCARPTAKRVVMAFRVQSKHIEFLLTYWYS